jgi:Spy/CpxP family protein refolding chaperone
MKRASFLLLAVFFAIAFAASGAEAKSKKQCSTKGEKHSRSYKNGHGANYKSGAGYFGHLVEKLDLTDEQLEGANKLKRSYQKETIRLKAEIKIEGVDLQELLDADTVNMNKVKRKVKAIYDLKAELKIYRIQVTEELKPLLTDEQKSTLKACKSKHGRASVKDGQSKSRKDK